MTCLVIIAFMCINGLDKASFTPASSLESAHVEIGSSDLWISLTTDNPRELDYRQMSRACEGDLCIAYHKRCETKSSRLMCTYYYLRPGDKYGNSFTIFTSNSGSLSILERRLGILTQSGWLSGVIGLERMNVVSNTYAPFCTAEGPGPRCWPNG